MNQVVEFVSQPWHWSISGVMIVAVMGLLLFFGGQFGVSSNLRTLCAIGGAGKKVPFFNFDWRSQLWNLTFIGGAIIGGYIGTTWLANPHPVDLCSDTLIHLEGLGIDVLPYSDRGMGFVPWEIFSIHSLFTARSIIILVGGGFLIGFGTRWAGGCTSGHAISGLSNLQIPSLIAVCGFFIGGLMMTWVFLPLILKM